MTTGTTASGTYYFFNKKEQSIPIVFIHGVGLTHEIWQPQLDFFKDCSTLSYDILGHGKSSLNKQVINFDDFSDQLINLIDELNNLFLRIKLDEGRIGFSNSSVMWRDNLKIILKDSQLNNENDEVNLTGKIIFEFNELDNFYRSFQIQKVYRKDIKEIQIDFVFNFDNKKIFFDNVRVDNSQNLELEKYVNDFNNSKNRIFNKITFKNFVNNFFAAYAG